MTVFTPGQRVIHDPGDDGPPSAGTFERYHDDTRAYFLRDGDRFPVLIHTADLTASTQPPPAHITRVSILEADLAGPRRPCYNPQSEDETVVTCSCGWSTSVGVGNWSAAHHAARQHEQTAADPQPSPQTTAAAQEEPLTSDPESPS